MEEALQLYVPESDFKPQLEREIRSRIIKDRAVELCIQYPQAFVLLPVESQSPDKGSWGKYPFDEAMEFWINSSHPEALNFFKRILTEEKEAMMSQELTKQEDVGIKKMLAANIKAIKTVLPKHMTPERMMRIAYTAISRSPGLARCTPISLLNAVIEASMLGLEVNSPLGQASMVPFWNSRTGKFEAQLIPEYKGKIELAYRSGLVRSFQAHPVFAEDKFHYQYGLDPTLVHVPSKKADRGNLIAAYAVVNYINGGVDFEVIEEGDAMAAKAKSASARQDEKNKTSLSVWNSEDEPAMWMKTAVHRLFKRVPKSPEYREIARAQELEARAEAGEPQDFDYLDGEIIPAGELGTQEGNKPEEEKKGDDGAGKPPEPGKAAEATPKPPQKEEEPPPPSAAPELRPGEAKQGRKEEKQREEGGAVAGAVPASPNPPPAERKTEASPQSSKGTNMQQVLALFKANPKLYYQAAQEVGADEVNTDAAALLVLKKSKEISERTKKK